MTVHSSKSTHWTIVCDFDGTIALSDVTDRLLERFAAPQWLEFEKAWQAGSIGSRECLMRQTELLTMTADELAEMLADIPVDPAFAEFASYAESRQCAVRVASEGYTQVILALLTRIGAPALPIVATYMIRSGRNQWMLGCPYSDPACSSRAATCKCTAAREGRPADAPVLVIGDGRSDFCVAAQADFVFARGALLEFCRSRALPHAAVGDFSEAKAQLAALLALGHRFGEHSAAVAEQRYG